MHKDVEEEEEFAHVYQQVEAFKEKKKHPLWIGVNVKRMSKKFLVPVYFLI